MHLASQFGLTPDDAVSSDLVWIWRISDDNACYGIIGSNDGFLTIDTPLFLLFPKFVNRLVTC
jgi:hypothetical protein